LGGLSKKAYLIKGLAAGRAQTTMIINSGNLLFNADTLPQDTLKTATIAADGIIRASQKMGAKLAGIGTRDLTAGTSFLRQSQETTGFTWLSLNIVDPATAKPLFTPVLFRKVSGLQIAILALTDHTAFNAPDRIDTFQVTNWRDVLPQALATVRSKADIILLLSNYSFVENKEIARSYTDIDLILQSGHSLGNMAPIVINKTLFSQTETRGKYLGVMDIEWKGRGQWSEGSAFIQPTKGGGQHSFYTNRFIAIKQSMTDEPEIEALVRQTQRRIDKQQRSVR
jgi:2',3'-cyclic-nucleotide 2'-phosphodiesterase (5'-nucleotidase family)